MGDGMVHRLLMIYLSDINDKFSIYDTSCVRSWSLPACCHTRNVLAVSPAGL